MARIARLLKRWPELMVLLKGIGIATRSVFSTLMLLMCVVYVFALAIRYMTIDTEVGDKYFSSTPTGMKFLFFHSAMPDTMDFIEETGAETAIAAILIVIFVLMTTLTLMNMLIGVVCEVMSIVSTVQQHALKMSTIKEGFRMVLQHKLGEDIDEIESHGVTKKFFQTLLMETEVVRLLHEVGVDPVGLIDYIDHIFNGDLAGSDSKQVLSFNKLVEVICDLSGTNHCTVKDVVDMRLLLTRQIGRVESLMMETLETSQRLETIQQLDNARRQTPSPRQRPPVNLTLDDITCRDNGKISPSHRMVNSPKASHTSRGTPRNSGSTAHSGNLLNLKPNATLCL
jgi:hypothetical protein